MKLKEVFPNWASNGGIFEALNTYTDVPWSEETITISLDAYYYGNHSGDKNISPLVESLLSDEALSDSAVEILAKTIVALFGISWNKDWATLNAEYDPIENYSMTEQMTDDITIRQYGKSESRTPNLSHTKTGTETEAPNLTSGTNNSVYAFNSDDPVPTGSQQQTSGGNTVTTYNTTEAETGSESLQHGGSDRDTRNYRLTRSGNIGVTTSQQMIEQERALWVWNYFINVVFPDVDKVLTINIY